MTHCCEHALDRVAGGRRLSVDAEKCYRYRAAPSASVTAPTSALKTPCWGEPDLQGIWTDEFATPLQRPAKYAEQEFFTEAQRAELDKERTEMLNRRVAGTLADAYNFAAFLSTKRTGTHTSKIVDPPNGRTPPLTAEAQKAAAPRANSSPCRFHPCAPCARATALTHPSAAWRQ
jgi:hypothetical protein